MQYQTRTFTLLLIALVAAAGCARATDQRTSQPFPPSGPIIVAPTTPPPPAVVVAPSAPPTVVAPSAPAVVAAPIPGHPPVDTTGVVKSYDSSTGTITFTDGRVMKLTDRSKVLKPSEATMVRPGDVVIVRNALPVALQSASAAGRRQKMGTVAAVDQQNEIVLFTDGTAVRIRPTANMRAGMAGQNVLLSQLRPGDELVIVFKDPATVTSSGVGSAGSALPRQVTTAPGSGDEVDEVLIFREAQVP